MTFGVILALSVTDLSSSRNFNKPSLPEVLDPFPLFTIKIWNIYLSIFRGYFRFCKEGDLDKTNTVQEGACNPNTTKSK